MTSRVMAHGRIKPMIICFVAAFGSSSSGWASLYFSTDIIRNTDAADERSPRMAVSWILSIQTWRNDRMTVTTARTGPLRQKARTANTAAAIEGTHASEKPAKMHWSTNARSGRIMEMTAVAIMLYHLLWCGC